MTDSSNKNGDTENIPKDRTETIHLEAWQYFNDRPLSETRHDRLWNADRDLVRTEFHNIAQWMVAPLRNAAESSFMTFAILGDWGSGKSSFLRMLKDEVNICAGGEKSRLCFCEYNASSYAHTGEGMESLRQTLGLQILRALMGEEPDEKLMTSYGLMLNAGSPPISNPNTRPFQVGQWAQDLAIQVTRLVDFPRRVGEKLRGTETTAGKSQVLIVLVDDLDRCPAKFVQHVLRVSQEWADTENVFFVLAINREWLSKAIASLGGLDSETDYALEKYVQHSVSLPSLDGERLTSYVKDLLGSFDDPVSKTIVDNVKYIEKGLRYKTPRAVKRLLNSVKSKLQNALSSTTASEIKQRLIKEQVLQYSWPEFYRRQFEQSTKERARGLGAAWGELELACRTYVQDLGDPDDERLEFSLRRIGKKLRDPDFDKYVMKEGLVHFLAEEPYWVFVPSGGTAGDDSIPRKESDANLDFGTAVEPEVDVDSEFVRLYFSGRAKEDPRDQLELYNQAADLAYRNKSAMPRHRADEIGNMALAAENHRAYDLASKLFRLALDMNAEHPNNMQNFASFIADTNRQDFYELADELIERLQMQHPDFKPERTFRLRIQLAKVRGQPVAVTEDDIKRLLARVSNAPDDFGIWGNAMLAAGDTASSYELMRRLLEIGCSRESARSATEVYRRIRSFADQISDRKESPQRRQEAMEIYRRLLSNPDRYIEKTDVDAVRHNYATLLFTGDIDDEAGRLWHRAYYSSPNNRTIRGAYANYLSSGKRPDLAESVLQGQPLDEMFLWPRKVPLPDHHSDESYIQEAFALLDELSDAQSRPSMSHSDGPEEPEGVDDGAPPE